MFKITIIIYRNSIIYNITNLPTHINEFKTDFINLLSLKTLIVIVAPEALKVGNAITVDLTTNIITKLSIQSKKILLNQATALCCQSTHIKLSIKYVSEC